MLEKIEKLNIETSKLRSDGTYGMFVLEPLQSGYGNTLGNSLRRVLLSSLPGVAATSVKIDGVQHEFSTVPGVKEDVTELILNIKGLRAKMYGEAPKTIYIEAEGEGEVTAGDIKTDSEVEILDPGMHIATLSAGAKLFMDITLDRGRGYVSAELNKEQLAKELTPVQIGDTVRVHVKVKEGSRERIQAFEGTVIAKKHGGIEETITVRRLSYGVGVEKVFPVHSPSIDHIEVVRSGKVRRAKLYYLRERVGRSAKLKEKL